MEELRILIIMLVSINAGFIVFIWLLVKTLKGK